MEPPAADQEGQGGHAADLEALIGEIRLESARMRAAPEFPLDHEATIGIELDRLAPSPDRPRLERLADIVEALGRSEPLPSRPGWTRRRKRLDPSPGVGSRTELAGALADALRSAASRLADLEARVSGLEHRGRYGEARRAGPPSGALPPDLSPWVPSLLDLIGTGPGRVLYAGPYSQSRLAAFRDSGADAYALSESGDDDVDTRVGELVEHLRRVGDSGLAVVIIESPANASAREAMADLASELARTAATIVVMSEAPWWWAERLGPVAADQADGRPAHSETWISRLDQAGCQASARYDEDGHSYLVTARRRSP